MSDFEFVFNLGETTRSEGDDPLLDMIRLFLVDIQNMGYLCRGDERVYVDGFVLNNDPKTTHRLQDPPGAEADTRPRPRSGESR